jgi:hypothetical protein
MVNSKRMIKVVASEVLGNKNKHRNSLRIWNEQKEQAITEMRSAHLAHLQINKEESKETYNI